MIVNISEYIKNNFFKESGIPWKNCIISDTKINTKYDFYKIDSIEPVWQIIALCEKYDNVFVVLDRLNYDNIYRLYKNNIQNICIINLNSWYTWIWKKTISPDLDDIYINKKIEVLEPMDLENFKFYIFEFLEEKKIKHIRIANKDMEEKIWQEEFSLNYKEIINFNQFGIQWFSWTILSYGSMLQESLNSVWLLQSEWIWVDMFWIGNYKLWFSPDLIKSLENQDKIFIIGDFSKDIFKNFIYSQFYKYWILKEDIYFITPENTDKQVFDEVLSESVELNPVKIYERIRENIEI